MLYFSTSAHTSQYGHIEVVKILLDAGADVNVKVEFEAKGYTAIHFAALKGHNYKRRFKSEAEGGRKV